MDSHSRRVTFDRRTFIGAVGALVLAGCDSRPSSTPTTATASSTTMRGPTSSSLSRSSLTASSLPTPIAPITGSIASQSAGASTTSSTTTTSAGANTTTSSAARKADFRALAKNLSGTVILPEDKDYQRASELFNPRFDDIHPQAVARCASASDVAECVTFGRRTGVPLAVRSGGHCYEGWSVGPGLVIDTGPLNTVTVNSGTATVGAGARLIDVYSALADAGVGISGGSCPTVGIAGLTLGGGLGVVDRAWGLACDNLTGVEVVTADGQAITCTPSKERDLFWACQGGAGGTFGVATSFTFRTRPAVPVATWGRSWPWSRAAAVIAAWLTWVPDAPDELWGSVHLSSAPGRSTPSVSVVGTYLGGDVATLNGLLDGFVSAVGSTPTSGYAHAHSFLEAMLIDAGCGDKSLPDCHLQPAGTVTRQAYAASSDWIDKPMRSAGIATLLRAVQQRHDTRGAPDVAVQLDASGGAINRVRPAATAFVHRTAICSVQYIANWHSSTPATAIAATAAWPHQTRQAMQPYVSGRAYQNYVDGRITNWQQAYFGTNYRRLQRVKAHYDPGDLFHHPQSVTA